MGERDTPPLVIIPSWNGRRCVRGRDPDERGSPPPYIGNPAKRRAMYRRLDRTWSNSESPKDLSTLAARARGKQSRGGRYLFVQCDQHRSIYPVILGREDNGPILSALWRFAHSKCPLGGSSKSSVADVAFVTQYADSDEPDPKVRRVGIGITNDQDIRGVSESRAHRAPKRRKRERRAVQSRFPLNLSEVGFQPSRRSRSAVESIMSPTPSDHVLYTLSLSELGTM